MLERTTFLATFFCCRGTHHRHLPYRVKLISDSGAIDAD